MELLTTILPALLPVLSDGVRGAFNRWTGGAGMKPANVQEAVQLAEADTKRLDALARLDAVGANVSAWVNNIRALQRPVAALLIILGYIGAVVFVAPENITLQLGDYAQMVTFYLFGDRTYMYLTRRK